MWRAKQHNKPTSPIGDYAIWTFRVDGKDVTTMVRIIDRDPTKRFQHRELQVETNTGARTWISPERVEMVTDPL